MQPKRGPKRYEMRPISATFNAKLFQRKGRPLLKLYSLQNRWVDIVGDVLAGKSFPQMLDRGKLLIAVENPVWAQQLGYLKLEIVRRVKEVLGEELSDVKCVQQMGALKPIQNVYEKKPTYKLSAEELLQNRHRSLEDILNSTWSKLNALKKPIA